MAILSVIALAVVWVIVILIPKEQGSPADLILVGMFVRVIPLLLLVAIGIDLWSFV